MALTLGPVRFQGFEIPDQINFGGRQALVTHTLPGGGRVVDAMGRDDDEIQWQGRFRAGTAERRARAVDALRAAGTPVTLAWGGFRYTVVVAEFRAEYRQRYEIPYTVSCVVVGEPAGVPALSGLADLLGVDLSAALGLSGSLDIESIADAVGNVQAAVAAAKSLRNGVPADLAGLGDAVGIARGVVGQGVAAADAVFGLAGLPSSDAGGFASGVLAQADAMTRLDTLHRLGGAVGRMAATVKSLGG